MTKKKSTQKETSTRHKMERLRITQRSQMNHNKKQKSGSKLKQNDHLKEFKMNM